MIPQKNCARATNGTRGTGGKQRQSKIFGFRRAASQQGGPSPFPAGLDSFAISNCYTRSLLVCLSLEAGRERGVSRITGRFPPPPSARKPTIVPRYPIRMQIAPSNEIRAGFQFRSDEKTTDQTRPGRPEFLAFPFPRDANAEERVSVSERHGESGIDQRPRWTSRDSIHSDSCVLKVLTARTITCHPASSISARQWRASADQALKLPALAGLSSWELYNS